MLLGTTYSHKQSTWLSLDPIKTFNQLLALKFDSIRLCCYWSEIEQTQGAYDFSRIEQFLTLAEKAGQKVIVTVGVKAPRWPEFYIPAWIKKHKEEKQTEYALKFIEQTINRLKGYNNITHWQVENEPFDPSGPENKYISAAILSAESVLVKKLDPSRETVITLWANDLAKRKHYMTAAALADIVGLDLYYKQFITKQLSLSLYAKPKDRAEKIMSCMKSCGKPFWITELQAEPWENDDKTFRSAKPKSMNPELLKQFYAEAKALQPEAIYLWGSEYWFWKYAQGDDGMLSTVKEILSNERQ